MDRLSNLGLSHNAAPSSSSTFINGQGQSLAARLKPNRGGLSAYQRERDLSARYGAYGSGSSITSQTKKTEWDVLKENHRFIRDDEDEGGAVSWEERLARAYESKLFKEFALIDLKHYKSKEFALRWRTAPEVVDGIGEDTCAGLRCKWHRPSTSEGTDEGRHWSSEEEGPGHRGRGNGTGKRRKRMPTLKAFELPFRYMEAGEPKEALVKVRLCPKCVGKLLWKPKPADEEDEEKEDEGADSATERGKARRGEELRSAERNDGAHGAEDRRRRQGDEGEKDRRRDRLSDRHRHHSPRDRDRSRSPRRRRNEI